MQCSHMYDSLLKMYYQCSIVFQCTARNKCAMYTYVGKARQVMSCVMFSCFPSTCYAFHLYTRPWFHIRVGVYQWSQGTGHADKKGARTVLTSNLGDVFPARSNVFRHESCTWCTFCVVVIQPGLSVCAGGTLTLFSCCQEFQYLSRSRCQRVHTWQNCCMCHRQDCWLNDTHIRRWSFSMLWR